MHCFRKNCQNPPRRYRVRLHLAVSFTSVHGASPFVCVVWHTQQICSLRHEGKENICLYQGQITTDLHQQGFAEKRAFGEKVSDTYDILKLINQKIKHLYLFIRHLFAVEPQWSFKLVLILWQNLMDYFVREHQLQLRLYLATSALYSLKFYSN